MNILAYAKLLAKKINSADRKAVNPFLSNGETNPFARPYRNTLVWIEDDDFKYRNF